MTGISDSQYISSMAQRTIAKNENGLQQAMARLSSGKRINSAKDDAAGLAISERMMAISRGNLQAIENAQFGISFAQTAEGALQEVSDMLQRMRELAVQSANGIFNSDDRQNIDQEYQAINDEVFRTLNSTEFNGYKILSFDAQPRDFQVGAQNANSNQVRIDIPDVDALLFPIVGSTNVVQQSMAFDALDALDDSIDTVTSFRAQFGVLQSKFGYVINSLRVAYESSEASRSRIVDADFAQESAALSRRTILQQSGMAMLTQANAMNDRILTLIR